MPPAPSRVAALGDELVRIHDSLRTDLRRLRDAAATGAAASGVPGTGGVSPGRPLAVHCLAFCTALTRHHTGEDAGAFPALGARFPDLAPLLEKMAQDHDMIAGIVARVEEIGRTVGGGPAPALAAELDGLAAIMESHFSFEERRIRAALDRLDRSPEDLLGA